MGKEISDNQLLFAKVREGAKIPTKSDDNAGYDVYACIDIDKNDNGIVISPHETRLIPTGISSAFSKDYYIKLFERGSTGSIGMKVSCGVIDSNYRGEWFVSIYNGNNKDIILTNEPQYASGAIEKYQAVMYPLSKAICQAVVLPVPTMNISEVDINELKSYSSNREDGKLGSTGK